VWVLVTSVEPLSLWIFKETYLRFTSEDYDPSKLRNKFMHLTNASINVYNPAEKKVKKRGKYTITHNMWDRGEFQHYLSNEYAHLGDDPYTDKIEPQIKEGVLASLLAVKDQMVHRDRSHALFGYDFMVDEDLNVWLIEVNCSPSMEYSSPTTERLCKQVLTELPRILLDGDHGREALDGPDTTGGFERIYN